ADRRSEPDPPPSAPRTRDRNKIPLRSRSRPLDRRYFRSQSAIPPRFVTCPCPESTSVVLARPARPPEWQYTTIALLLSPPVSLSTSPIRLLRSSTGMFTAPSR